MSFPIWIKHEQCSWAQYPEGTKAREGFYDKAYVKVGNKWVRDADTVVDIPKECTEVCYPEGYMERMIDWKTPNKGYMVRRTRSCLRELSFAEEWAKRAERDRAVCYGQGLAQDLFIDEKDLDNQFCSLLRSAFYVAKLTKRERMIIATVVQWLGTNCGMEFLRTCLNKCGYKLVRKED